MEDTLPEELLAYIRAVGIMTYYTGSGRKLMIGRNRTSVTPHAEVVPAVGKLELAPLCKGTGPAVRDMAELAAPLGLFFKGYRAVKISL